jgi:predicted nucleic acid-binding protein
LIVVDASVLVGVTLGHPDALGAVADGIGHAHEPLHAPALIEPEVINALRGLARGERVTVRRATEALSDLASVRLVRYPHSPLRERVWSLRDSLTAYDASYVALAQLLDESTLMTADGAMARVAKRVLGADRVRLAD